MLSRAFSFSAKCAPGARRFLRNGACPLVRRPVRICSHGRITCRGCCCALRRHVVIWSRAGARAGRGAMGPQEVEAWRHG